PHSAAMFDNSAVQYYYGCIDDGVYIEDSLPPQETKFSVSDDPWSQPARKFEPCRDVFDPSSALQNNRGVDGHRLGYAQQYLQHAPAHPVSAISQLDDIFPLGHEQCNPTTVQPEHLQYDPAPARTPEHASSTAHNTPFGLEARLPSSDTATLRPWNPQHAASDAPNVDMYYEPLQASRYGEHSAGRPTQQAFELARQPGVVEAGFGATLDYSTNITYDFATQFPAPHLPYSYTKPATVSHPRIPYDTPMSSSDF
ncbi:hypothetical protein K525DRAFT_162008, partial [Schizophyllum commune Loenen D]